MSTATTPALIRPRPTPKPSTLEIVTADTLERFIRDAAAELASRGRAERARLMEVLTSELDDAATAQRLSHARSARLPADESERAREDLP